MRNSGGCMQAKNDPDYLNNRGDLEKGKKKNRQTMQLNESIKWLNSEENMPRN